MKGKGTSRKSGPVSIVSCDDYGEPDLTNAIVKCLAPLGGIRAFVHPGDRVLLKVNLLAAKPPESGVCTRPEMARAVAGLVRDAGGEPFFGDSPGGRSGPGHFLKVVSRSGLAAVAEELGVEVVRFDDEPVTISHPDGRIYRRFEVARAVTEADAIISMPRFKTHNLTGLTAGVKNLFGCVPGYRKVGYHVTAGRGGVGKFAELLVDLAAAIRPALTLLDAVVAMEGDGPTSGDLRKLGVLMASADPFAMDLVAAELVGVSPVDLPTVVAAEKAGVGPRSLEEVEVVGEELGPLCVDDFVMPRTWDPAERYRRLLTTAARAFAPRPRIRRNACVNCNACVDGCPTGALVSGEQTPKYVHRLCIRCYCCAEFCTHDAVEIVRALKS